MFDLNKAVLDEGQRSFTVMLMQKCWILVGLLYHTAGFIELVMVMYVKILVV